MIKYATPKWFVKDIIARACGSDEQIMAAFSAIPREAFVDEAIRAKAYEDITLPIGFGQTISQPSLVAFMIKLLDIKPTDTVLEIGSGSGYLTGLLSRLCSKVYAVELLAPLYERTRAILRGMNLYNIRFRLGDGAEGWSEFAPFDKVIASAGATKIPQELVSQLKVGGIMLLPLNSKLTKCVKTEEGLSINEGIPVSFVDFVGS